MAKESKAQPAKNVKDNAQPSGGLTFGRENYIILLAGVIVLALGYILMIGGGSDDVNKFNGEELFSTRRITIAPITLIIGFVIVLVGIMRKPKN
ncbi:MAG: hypothetical protein FD123_2103 [Bacteroidetes bacterium]|nr:MAG: hypothetical protein FD123_2103 [Bacteroidota bacterium]